MNCPGSSTFNTECRQNTWRKFTHIFFRMDMKNCIIFFSKWLLSSVWGDVIGLCNSQLTEILNSACKDSGFPYLIFIAGWLLNHDYIIHIQPRQYVNWWVTSGDQMTRYCLCYIPSKTVLWLERTFILHTRRVTVPHMWNVKS